jgi:hypothetical protein
MAIVLFVLQLVLVLVLVSIPVMVVLGISSATKRKKMMREFAAARSYLYQGSQPLPRELWGLPFFSKGTQGLGIGRHVKNFMTSQNGQPQVLLFDYWYTEVGGVSGIRMTLRWTVVCLRDGVPSPWQTFPHGGTGYLPQEEIELFLDGDIHDWKQNLPR